MSPVSSVLLLFVFFIFVNFSYCAKILVLFPYGGASHFSSFSPLLEGLALRGHKLDVFSYLPREKPLDNYRDISLEKVPMPTVEMFGFDRFAKGQLSVPQTLMRLWDMSTSYQKVHSLPEVLTLANSTYDLTLIEMFNSDLFYGLAHKIGAPTIGLSSCSLMTWSADSVAAPTSPSFILNNLAGHPLELSLWSRIVNTLEVWASLLFYKMVMVREAQSIAESFLGPLPPLQDIAANTSLVLINTHFTLTQSRPLPPSVVEVGGLNVLPPQPLPKDLNQLLNASTEGAIYFSMGSVLIGESLPPEKEAIFRSVLTFTGRTVLWKRKGQFQGSSKNIITRAWFPQRDILAHPKIALFISHCGLLGTNEALVSGVPILCIPIFGDQPHNARYTEAAGISKVLDYWTLTEAQFRGAVEELLTNPRYKERAMTLSAAFKDRPMSPLDTAIYWVEYVLRHGGEVLRSPSAKMPYWKREGLDVVAVLLTSLLCVVLLLVKIGSSSKRTLKRKEKRS